MKLINSEKLLKRIDQNCFLVFGKHVIDFSEVISFGHYESEFHDYYLGITFNCHNDTDINLIFEIEGETLKSFISEIKSDYPHIDYKNDDDFDNFLKDYTMKFIFEKLVPTLNQVKSEKISTVSKNISIKSETGDELYSISLNNDGSLFIEANLFAKVNNIVLEKQLSIEMKNYNSFSVYRKPYLV